MLDAVIIGAGPYGLSMAAHFRRRGIRFRIFGRPMDSWLSHMPKGMLLKSDGFASNLYDPGKECTLKQFCLERGIPYADTGIPVALDTFVAYGVAFQERMVPMLEQKLVTGVDRLADGFMVRLDDGETLTARRVVVAVGITHFDHMPPALAHLHAELASHSSRHRDLERFRGRNVIVLGSGASALDLAGLLKETGADVQLAARAERLRFHTMPTGESRSPWQQIRHPHSGLGPGIRSRFFANSPLAFSYLPAGLRLWNVRRALGPSGGWFSKNMVVGKVPLLLGHHLERADAQESAVHLHFRIADGTPREVVAEHVIAATGYKVEITRLQFLSEAIRGTVRVIGGAPVLSSSFESTVPSLYFVGTSAANTFGPVMRFAFGARFAAEHLTHVVAKSLSGQKSGAPSPLLAADPE